MIDKSCTLGMNGLFALAHACILANVHCRMVGTSLSLEMSSWTSLINCKLKPNTLHETNILRPWTYAILKRKEVVIFQAIEKSSGKFLVAGHLLTPAVLSLTLPQFEIQRSRCHSAVLFYRIFYCKYLHYKFVCSPNGPLGFMKHWIHGADLLSIVSASEQQVVFLLLLNWNDKQIPTRTFLPGLFAILFVLIQDSQKHLEDSAKSKIRTT